ncbi:MAG TPA: MurR/RpiR family transcriptional regulator [Lachnospiraceae bacterium]|jgi:DNA-binding MurR/RpiR family transcriptional regulator|nr:MurR/RpiR family transcriptional regulator [Lachnospiraceae bacterium]
MQGDFITNIKSMYNQFSRTEKKVADYILKNPTEVPFMSITDLADACGVGDTTVFRLCRTLDLKGYQEFKMMLSLSITNDEEKTEQYSGNINLKDDFPTVAQKVLNTNVAALNETYSLLNYEDMDKAIRYLRDAERVFFFGVGASLLTAMKAMNKFLRIESKVYCYEDSHMQLMAASMLGPKDVAFIFSYSGSTKDTIEIAKNARAGKAHIICITRFIKSPLTAYADILLLSGANEGPLQGGSTSAEISQLFLIDILYMEYYRRYFDSCSRTNKITSESVVERLV